MSYEDEDDRSLYYIVKNYEAQYSIWRADKEIPKGWSAVEETASKQQCLDRIKELWTDMRPLSLQKQMASTDPAS